MIKWRCRASHLGRFTLWHKGRRATQLGRFSLCTTATTAAELLYSVDLLCGTAAAELQNSVDLLYGTTVAELQNSVNLLCDSTAAELNNPVWCRRQESHTFSKDSDEPCLIQRKILLSVFYLPTAVDLQQSFEGWTLWLWKIVDRCNLLKDERFRFGR